MQSIKLMAITLSLGFLIPQTGFAATGKAHMKGTAADSNLTGTAEFSDTQKGLRVSIEIKNAPAGKLGLHIHEFGSCDDMGNAAGGHYNPLRAPHGHIVKDGPKKAHKGDLGNIEIGDDGTGKLEKVIPNIALTSGRFTVGGRSVILHERADDYSQPLGNAGGRIACGLIGVTGN